MTETRRRLSSILDESHDMTPKTDAEVLAQDDMGGQLHEATVQMVMEDLKHLWFSGKSLFEVLDVVYETMRQIIPFDRMSVAFYNEETGMVVSRWVRSETEVKRVDKGYWAELKGS
ncbi:hypothetical protein JXD38_07640, partial [candidate division WOR-3 bacterium]|nr:hypothetical protein [candidate division WOR-3 bacterium]